MLWYILYLGVSKSDPLLTHLPKPPSLNRKSFDLMLVIVGGGSPCPGIETGRSVVGLHMKNWVQLTWLASSSLQMQIRLDQAKPRRDPLRFDQILTRPVEISIIGLHWFQLETNHYWPKPKPTRLVVSSSWQWVNFSAT